jgi:hypothetical protein
MGDSMDVVEESLSRQTGTPDSLGVMYSSGGKFPRTKEVVHQKRYMDYHRWTCSQNECSYYERSEATMSKLKNAYLDQILEVNPRYAGAAGSGPTSFEAAAVDYTLLATLAVSGGNVLGKTSEAMQENTMYKIKNNSGTTMYLDIALFTQLQGKASGTAGDVISSLENTLVNKSTRSTDNQDSGTGTTFNKSLMVNLLGTKYTGDYRRVGYNKRTLKPGQYCFVKVVTAWYGDIFHPTNIINGVAVERAKKDYRIVFRLHGDIGSTDGGQVGTMAGSLDVCVWQMSKYVAIQPINKKVRYIEMAGSKNDAAGAEIKNRNVDDPSDKIIA